MNQIDAISSNTVMLFIFLAFAMLLIMFYLLMRSLEDFKSTMTEQSQELAKRVDMVSKQLRELTRVEQGTHNYIRSMVEPEEMGHPVAEADPFFEDGVPVAEAAKQEPEQDEEEEGFSPGNITKYIAED